MTCKKYTVRVTEHREVSGKDYPVSDDIYEQSVDELNVWQVILAVNTPLPTACLK